MIADVKKSAEQKMQKSVEALKVDLGKVRTGRAHTGLLDHLMAVSQSIGKAIDEAFHPAKVGLMIAGLEVLHTHLHVIPIQELSDLNPANQDLHPNPADLDQAAEAIRRSLRALGFTAQAG